jgi:ATP-binding cassette subfamily B protein
MGLFRELSWFFKMEKKSYLIGVSMLVLVSLIDLLPPFVVGRIVDGINSGKLTPGEVMQWLLVIFAAAALAYGCRYVWRLMIFGASLRLGKLLRTRLYEHFTRMPPRFFQKRRTGDLMAHATNDVQAVELTASEGVLTLVDSFTVGGAVTMMMLWINWKLTLIVLLPLPLMAFATSFYGRRLHERFLRAQEGFSRLNDNVQENVAGIRVVKAFGLEEAEKRKFSDLSADVVRKNVAVAKVDALFDPTISFIVGISFLLAVSCGSFFVVRQDMTIGDLTSFTLYLGYLIWPMLAFGMLFNIVERGRASYKRISELLAVKAEIADRAGATDEVPRGGVEYAVSSFAYPDAETPALNDIYFCIPQGGTLGVVGRTGSGKTTLLRLLLREFDVLHGSIRIGGTSIYDVTLNALRSAVAYVPQDHFLFSATVAENIAFGKPEATMEEIIAAAKAASIHEDICRFPDGYGTIVGERGITLSGGQKQRLSIARALITGAPILVLDDALSAVDAKTEEAILRELYRRKQQTLLIAAHRLSAVEHADLILVLDGGRIVERGTHDELMAARGWYWSMYRRQQLVRDVAQGGGRAG